MKKHHQLLAVTFAIALASIARSAPPSEVLSPAELAMVKVKVEVFSKFDPPARPFSRAMPVHRHVIDFKPQILVKGEAYLPFEIKERNFGKNEAIPVALKGYVRLDGQEILLYDEKLEEYVPTAKHPLFAPRRKTIARPSTPG